MGLDDRLSTASEALANGQLGKAAQIAREALAVDPNNLAALTLVGKLAQLHHKPDLARALFAKILSINASHAETWVELTQALTDLGEHSEAMAAAAAATEVEPANVLAHLKHADLCISHNRPIDAEMSFSRALELAPRESRALAGLARLSGAKAPADLLDQLRARLGDVSTSSSDRALLHYALAHVFKASDPGQFIGNLFSAHEARGSATLEQHAYYARSFDRLEQFFSERAIQASPIGAVSSPTPIFVLGMPRSGSTLVERLLSAHPSVVAAGEINYMRGPLSWEVSAATGKPFPERFEAIPDEIFNSIAAGFRRRIDLIAKSARYVVDKTPGNFHLVGLLVRLFPDALIIHTTRDPMDTCFSVLQYRFDERSPHTWDMALLGAHYRRYQRLMEYWERIFPDRIHSVRYEQLVTSPETETRRMFGFCGLAYEDRYLSCYQSAAPVRTFSNEQVRKPIYQSSIGSWLPFEKELAPLLRALTSSS